MGLIVYHISRVYKRGELCILSPTTKRLQFLFKIGSRGKNDIKHQSRILNIIPMCLVQRLNIMISYFIHFLKLQLIVMGTPSLLAALFASVFVRRGKPPTPPSIGESNSPKEEFGNGLSVSPVHFLCN